MSGCTFSDFESGKCQLWDSDYAIDCMGYDSKGICIVEDDPCPYDSCESFEPIDPYEEFDCI